jgi:molybdate/tungstate transport system permease protein
LDVPRRLTGSGLLGALLGALLVLFIVGPILRLLWASSPATLAAAAGDPEVRAAIVLTVLTASAATGLALLLGAPLGYLLARYRFPGRSLLRGLLDLPVMIPHPVAGIALLLFLGRHSPLGGVLAAVGLEVVSHVPGIVAAMLFVSAPLMVSGSREAFASVDPTLERVARGLGDTRWQAFRRVTLPLSARGIVTGALLAWGRSVSEFGAIVILTYHPKVASVLIFDRFTLSGLPGAVPAATLLLLVALAVFILLRVLEPPPERPR